MILQRPVALREQEVVLHEEQVGREVRSKAGGWFGIMDPRSPSLFTIIIIITININTNIIHIIDITDSDDQIILKGGRMYSI